MPNMAITFGATLERAVDIYRAKFRERVPSMTMTQLLILDALSGREELNQADIVRATGVDRSTLSTTLRFLIRDGLVTKTGSTGDRRANLVALTHRGKRMHTTGMAAVERLESVSLQRERARRLLVETVREIAQVDMKLHRKVREKPANVAVSNALAALEGVA
jgi:DNA-binding MarR family transcriptional regulator